MRMLVATFFANKLLHHSQLSQCPGFPLSNTETFSPKSQSALNFMSYAPLSMPYRGDLFHNQGSHAWIGRECTHLNLAAVWKRWCSRHMFQWWWGVAFCTVFMELIFLHCNRPVLFKSHGCSSSFTCSSHNCLSILTHTLRRTQCTSFIM